MSGTRRRIVWGLTAAAVVGAVALSLVLGTLHNDQPARYHPDEPGKVAQLLSGRWNFHHPQAMLTVTRWVTRVMGPALPVDGEAVDRAALDVDVIARRGRIASALFVGLTTLALGCTAWLLHGRRAAVVVAMLVAVCPPLVLRAHYMKEDTALVAGLAVMALGLALMQRRHRWPGAGVLGVGLGLAAAGKYVGMIPAMAAAPLPLIIPGAGRWRTRPAVMLLAAAVGLAVWFGLNHEMLEAAEQFDRGWTKEWDHAFIDGHHGLYPPAWGTFFLDAIQYELPWLVLVAAAAGLGWFATHKGRRAGVAAWAIALFPLAYYVMLMPSSIGFGRYALPIMVALTYLAGVAAAVWTATIKRPHRRWFATVVLAAALLVPSAARTTRYLQGFADDSRDRLLAWVLEELPRGAVIAQEAYVALREHDLRPAGHRVRTWDTPMAQGDLDRLRRWGVTHVILASPRYFRYLDGHLRPMPGREAEVAQIQANYARLFAEGTLLWQSDPGRGTPAYTNPVLRVYDIRRR